MHRKNWTIYNSANYIAENIYAYPIWHSKQANFNALHSTQKRFSLKTVSGHNLLLDKKTFTLASVAPKFLAL